VAANAIRAATLPILSVVDFHSSFSLCIFPPNELKSNDIGGAGKEAELRLPTSAFAQAHVCEGSFLFI
jgi:hypothetical protein